MIESAYKVLAENPEGKKQVRRPCRKCENNIKVDRNRICGRGLENDKVQWETLVNTVMNLLVL
jgi:hypothetical protein